MPGSRTVGALAALALAGCSGAGADAPALPAGVSTEQAAESQPRGCPRESWPGPWTCCAEAEWVREVVRAAGYSLAGETGSALVATGDDTSFYVWTTTGTAEAVVASEAGSELLATVAGTRVYGDARLWRFWTAQRLVFWVKQGPEATAVLPRPAELRPLVEASRRIPASGRRRGERGRPG